MTSAVLNVGVLNDFILNVVTSSIVTPEGKVVPEISIGYPQPILQNVVYALPARRVLLFSDAASPTFVMANDFAFATSIPVVLTNGQAEIAAAFIKCTSASPGNIVVKAV
jgi:hypothetical protein